MSANNQIKKDKTKLISIAQIIGAEAICIILLYLCSIAKIPTFIAWPLSILLAVIPLIPFKGNNLMSRIKKVLTYSRRDIKNVKLTTSNLEDYTIEQQEVYSIEWVDDCLTCLLKYKPTFPFEITDNSELQSLNMNALVNALNQFDVNLKDITLQSFINKNSSKNKFNPIVNPQETYLYLKFDPKENVSAINRHGTGMEAAKKTLLFSVSRLVAKLKSNNIVFTGLTSQEVLSYKAQANKYLDESLAENWSQVTRGAETYSVYYLLNHKNLGQFFENVKNYADKKTLLKIQFSANSLHTLNASALVVLSESDTNKKFPGIKLLVGDQYPSFINTIDIAQDNPVETVELIEKNWIKDASIPLQANGTVIGVGQNKNIIGINYLPSFSAEILSDNNHNFLQRLIFGLVQSDHKILIIDDNLEKWKKLLETVNNPSKLGFSFTDKVPPIKLIELFDTLVYKSLPAVLTDKWLGSSLKIMDNLDLGSMSLPLPSNKVLFTTGNKTLNSHRKDNSTEITMVYGDKAKIIITKL